MDRSEPKPALIIGNRPTDFFAGSNSPINHEARNTTGDWKKFRSLEENQFNAKGDWWNCVNQSVENQFEAQANWALMNGLWPDSALKFFNGENSMGVSYIHDGKFKISTRFNSKMSGTQPGVGNWLYKGHDSIRKHGIVPDEAWPTLPDMTEDQYYSDVSDNVIRLGQESLRHYEWLYEFLVDFSAENLKNQLQQSPLQIGIACCPVWYSEEVINKCNLSPNHAILIEAVDVENIIRCLDHYPPYSRNLAPDYQLFSVVKGVLYPKGGNSNGDIIVSPLHKDIAYGDFGSEVSKLKLCLKKLGWLPEYEYSPDRVDVYDSSLARLVFRFQLANVSHVFIEMLKNLGGNRVGPRTRAVINEAIKHR